MPVKAYPGAPQRTGPFPNVGLGVELWRLVSNFILAPEVTQACRACLAQAGSRGRVPGERSVLGGSDWGL